MSNVMCLVMLLKRHSFCSNAMSWWLLLFQCRVAEKPVIHCWLVRTKVVHAGVVCVWRIHGGCTGGPQSVSQSVSQTDPVK